MKSLAKSLTDKGKEQKVHTPNPTMDMVKKIILMVNPLKRKKYSPSKTTLVNKDTSQKSHVSKRRRFEKVNKRIK